MTTKQMTANVEAIRDRLNLATTHLGRWECEQALWLSQQLTERLTCELWGHKHGWDIPVYGSPEWMEMQAAWLSD